MQIGHRKSLSQAIDSPPSPDEVSSGESVFIEGTRAPPPPPPPPMEDSAIVEISSRFLSEERVRED